MLEPDKTIEMNKIEIKTIIIQCIGIIFFIYGIQKLYLVSIAEKYDCYVSYFIDKDRKSECWQKLQLNEYGSAGDFLSNIYLWFFYGFIIGVFIVAFINFKKRISVLNTIFIFILLFPLFPIRFFRNSYTSIIFNSFGTVFSKELGVQNFIGGITFTLIGCLLLWKSYKLKLSTTHNSGLG